MSVVPERSNVWHVLPVNDLIDHDDKYDDCVCIPHVEAVPRADGSFGWVAVHHSLDGRELTETK